MALPPEDAGRLCNDVTHEGRVPEPVRWLRPIARGLVRSGWSDNDDRRCRVIDDIGTDAPEEETVEPAPAVTYHVKLGTGLRQCSDLAPGAQRL